MNPKNSNISDKKVTESKDYKKNPHSSSNAQADEFVITDITIEAQELDANLEATDKDDKTDMQESSGAQVPENSNSETDDMEDISEDSLDNEEEGLNDDDSGDAPSDEDSESDSEENLEDEGSKEDENPDGEEDSKEDEKSDGEEDSKDGEKPDGEEDSKDDEKSDGDKDSKDGEKPDGDKESKDGEKPDGDKESKDDEKPNGDKDSKDGQNPQNDDKNGANKDSGNNNDQRNEENSSSGNDNKNNTSDSGNKPSQDKTSNQGANNTPNNSNKGNSGSRRDNLKNKLGDKKNQMKDRAKQRANNMKQAAKNRAKQAARNAAENSNIGQAVNKAKDVADKTKKAVEKTKKAVDGLAKFIEWFMSCMPWSGIITLVAIGLIILLIFILMITSPGSGGDVKNESTLNSYSQTDQKTIEKIKELTEKYPSSDGALAMAVVAYPYFSELHGGTVETILAKKTDGTEDEPDEELDAKETEDEEEDEDKNDIEKEKGDYVDDDPYLEFFRLYRIRRKLKKVLKNTQGQDEDQAQDYLKKYFKDDGGYLGYEGTGFNGYKKLLRSVSSGDRDRLMDAIIEDIKEKKSMFYDYIFENKSCTANLQSAGTVEIDEMLKGNILVDVKVSSCTTGKNVWGCQSMYSSPITMEKYTKGVAYEEIGVSGSSDPEKVKAQLVAAKSYVIGRSKSMGWGTRKDANGNYVVTIRANTNDQDYCDIELGCKSGNTVVRSGSRKRSAVDSATKAVLDAAWEASKDVYIYNKKKSTTAGEFCNSRSGVCDFCKKGTCLAHKELENYHSTDFKTILSDQYSSYALITVNGEYATAEISSGTSCTNLSGSDIDDESFVYYAQNDFDKASDAFCGRTASGPKWGCAKGDTICTSGCGVTSTAMIMATLSQDATITPNTINSQVKTGTDCGNYGSNGGSLIAHMAKIYSSKGIKTPVHIETSVKALKDALDNGALILANVDGSMGGNGNYKTGGGHYIVIRGYDGNTAYVADPWQNIGLKSHCVSKNQAGHCVKAKTNIDNLVSNIRKHNVSGMYAVYGKVKFNQISIQSGGGTGNPGEATGTLGHPVSGVTGCDASDYPNYSSGKYHGGTDINSSANGGKSVEGRDVLAADGGTVATVKKLSYSYGNHVIINHGNGYYTLYAHMQKGSIVVKEGQKIKKGQKIGKVGSTGNSTGPHLHIELRKNNSHSNTLNPCKYIGKNSKYAK